MGIGDQLRVGSLLSESVSRPVRVATIRPAGASLERADPEQVLDPPGYPAYTENDWAGCTFAVGSTLLKGVGATPRCGGPYFGHGDPFTPV